MLLPKVFTVEEANALVPLLQEAFDRIHALVGRAQALRETIEATQTLAQRGVGTAAPQASRLSPVLADELKSVERAVENELMDLHRLGVVVKALEPGTVDVWAQRGTEWVHLCWQNGEHGFGHWHAVHEGIAGRKAIASGDEFGRRWPN
jgi:hypothetical protein